MRSGAPPWLPLIAVLRACPLIVADQISCPGLIVSTSRELREHQGEIQVEKPHLLISIDLTEGLRLHPAVMIHSKWVAIVPERVLS